MSKRSKLTETLFLVHNEKNLNLERSFVTVIKTDDNGTHDLLDYSDVVLKDYSMFGKKDLGC